MTEYHFCLHSVPKCTVPNHRTIYELRKHGDFYETTCNYQKTDDAFSALALYAVESALPPIVPIPGIKLGLSNIITLVVLWKYSAKDAFFVLLVRILLATMFFGQAMSLLYSLSGGILCLFAMLLVKLLLHGNYLFLASMTGAVFHNLGQIGVAFLLTSVPAVLVYLPFLLLSGLVTGLFIGLCARFTLRFLP